MVDKSSQSIPGSAELEGHPGLGRMVRLTDNEFRFIQNFVMSKVGIHLTNQKRSLVEGRLAKLMRTMGFTTYSAYIDYLQKDASGRALDELVNRISTNHTFFYREKAHFDFFVKTVLPDAAKKQAALGERDLRFWSAGCSSGEEPYNLVMLMKEHLGTTYASWKAGILATDVSANALTHAKRAVYDADRLKLMPPNLVKKYFRQTADGRYEVDPMVRQEVIFRRFNLMNTVFPFKKPFHAIFCRNVMIYFDEPTKKALVERFYRHTAPGGYLFIGHSESLGRADCPYSYLMPAVYRKD